MELLNILASKFNASNVQLLNKGWSDDIKYILTINNERFLLRLSNISLYESKKRQYKYLKEIAKLDIYCSKIIDFGTIENYVYMLFTYLEGRPAEEVLKNETNKLSAYNLGVIAGKYLRKIHSIKIINDEPSIYERFNNKLIKKIKALNDCPLKIKDEEMLLSYIEDNKHILKGRTKVLTHGDYHLGNMIINDNKGIGIIDFNKLKEEDPYDDFKPFVWSVRQNKYFESGLINGYFDNKVPKMFFKLLKLYSAEALISHIPWAYTFGEKEIKTGYEIYDLIMEWYDNFKIEVPTWYIIKEDIIKEDNMYKVVLFDLDGTLVDPVVGITNSIIHAFKKYNMEVKDRSELLKFIGPPLADSFQEFYGFSKEKAWEAMGFYREYYSVKGVFENTLYDGIEEMLKALKEHGYVIGLATSKPEPFARLIIESFKLTKYFDYIAGASFDDSRHQKEQVVEYALQTLNVTNPSEALMVGDRKFDVIGARINNMDCVGVLYGYGSEEELKAANAKYIVKTPQDIINLLCK